ncbi:MAG: KpsF/GutQ family sugar-phosphate isomerase [Calditrichaeota bacterium]|nr:MAG: KpsF/GutQ family sugar-phosphate isomerase [Calditrichota bacterium]
MISLHNQDETRVLKRPEAASILESAKRVITIEKKALTQLVRLLDENFVRAVEMILQCRGRVIVTGLGKSGVIGRKIAATLASTGTPSYFLHAAEGLHGDLGVVNREDVVICLSKSGTTEEIAHLLPVLRSLKVRIIAITANPVSPLARYSDAVLNIGSVTEACPHDLAPTSSTTAMLALGDALAITLLEMRGFSREDFAFLHPAGTLGKRLLLLVDDVMETGPRVPFVPEEASMKQAVLEMAEKRGICMVVTPDKKVLGVITTGDLNRLVEHTENFFHIPVREVMNPDPKVISVGTLAYTALKKMEHYRIIAMPVLDDSRRLVGVVHLHDLMQAGLV